jgi:hydroxylamine reductase (hybrid-cluster protein)
VRITPVKGKAILISGHDMQVCRGASQRALLCLLPKLPPMWNPQLCLHLLALLPLLAPHHTAAARFVHLPPFPQDLHDLLTQVEASGADINVYTHGEMLPAHGYPGA